MACSFGIVYPLWSETLEPRDWLERVHGEVGLDHVTVPLVTGPAQEFRLCDAEAGVKWFETRGGWHYRPEFTPAGDFKFPIADWLGKRDVLGALREKLEQWGVELALRLDVRGGVEAGRPPADWRMRDAWGNSYPGLGVCVNHPSVRELVERTLEDVRRYAPVVVELAALEIDKAVTTDGVTDMERHADLSDMRCVCWCPSCQQIGREQGRETAALERSLRVHFERLVREMVHVVNPLSPDQRYHDDEPLQKHLQGRRENFGAWLENVAQRARKTYGYERLLMAQGFDLVRPYRGFDDPPGFFDPPVEGLDWPCWGMFSEAAQLVRELNEGVKAGRQWHDLSGLTTAPPLAVEWAKQAVRFARRG